MITIISKRDGFRRAGIQHSSTATQYPDNHFSAAQLALLKAEPMLFVTDVPCAAKSSKAEAKASA